jgi:Tfp pilus assembly PilM family ATPase
MHPAAEEARPAKKRSWDWTAARRALAEAALPARAFSPRTVLGIDLGSSSVKAVRLARGRAGYRLLGWAMRENSRARREGDTDPLADILGDVIREAGGPADHVAVTLSGAGVQVHSLVLPDLPEREVRPAVEWQVQKEGGEDPAGICIDFVHAGPSEHGGATPTRVLAFSTPRALVEETLEAFRGVRVHRVTVAPCAHAGLMSACGNDGDYAFLDIGGGGSWISLFHGGRLAFTRRVGVGGRLFTQSLTQPVQTPEGPLKHSLADAEKAKRGGSLSKPWRRTA